MTMHNPTDEDLMAYVDGELDNQSELRDHIAANIDKYYERMKPFVLTRRLFNLIRWRPRNMRVVLDLSNTDEKKLGN